MPEPFLDLGTTPLANDFVPIGVPDKEEERYPLAVARCPGCELVQLTYVVPPERLFTEYAYLTSYSDTAVEHARQLAATLAKRFALDGESLTVEVASNDGTLLRFVAEQGLRVQGIDPAANAAAVAEAAGVPTEVAFFDRSTADRIVREHGTARVLVANNVLAHVPDIRGFLEAIRIVVDPDGAASIEFPWLAALIDHCEFDTIYHEHVFYLSLRAVAELSERAGLEVFAAEHLSVHGGSLRVFLGHAGRHTVEESVRVIAAEEEDRGLGRPERFAAFATEVAAARESLVDLLRGLRRSGAVVAAYGAPAKGNTLLNYCEIDTSLIEFTVDRSPLKQGRVLPGSRIPVYEPDHLRETRPDYVVILPWNLVDEITSLAGYVRGWGGRFIVPVPKAEVLP